MGNFISILTSLTGGGAKSLDSIDGNALSDGDLAEVWTSAGIYRYRLDATASATENSPLRINPDTNAGTKSWCLVWTSARIGALVTKTSDQSITNTTLSSISFDTEVYDDAGFHESITNPTRLTIPLGISNVVVRGNAIWAANNTGIRLLIIYKNGAAFDGAGRSMDVANSDAADNVQTHVIPVTANDYFEFECYQNSGGSLNLLSSEHTWFSIEATHFA